MQPAQELVNSSLDSGVESDTQLRLVLTALPHFVAVLIASTYGHPYYAAIMSAAITANMVGLRSGRLHTGLTVAWILADTCLWPKSLLLNVVVWTLYGIMPLRSRWNLVSAGKAILVAACV
jgi:hypothetical protein